MEAAVASSSSNGFSLPTLRQLATALLTLTGRRALSSDAPSENLPLETDAEVAQENMNHFIDSDIAKGVAAVFSTVAIVSAREGSCVC